jgi:hypothetical protein
MFRADSRQAEKPVFRHKPGQFERFLHLIAIELAALSRL